MIRKYIDINLFKYLVLFYTVVALINGLRYTYWKIKYYLNDSPTWTDIWVINIFLDWFVVLILMLFISNATKRMIERKMKFRYIFFIHLLCSLAIGFIIFALSSFIAYIFLGDINRIIRNTTFDHFMRVIDINFLVYVCMISIVYSYYYIKKIKEVEKHKLVMQTQLTSVRMNVLNAQLHPHFMFNTLNSISSLITVDKEKSQNLIQDFSNLFKDVLEYKEDNLIPLKEEIALLDKYIDIVSVRFLDQLKITKNIDKSVVDVLVPNLILQPLLENSIKHGYSYHKTELRIDLIIFKKEEYLSINIANDGQLTKLSFDKLAKRGMGIKNTQERLQTLYGNNFIFTVKNKADFTGVETCIEIPILGDDTD